MTLSLVRSPSTTWKYRGTAILFLFATASALFLGPLTGGMGEDAGAGRGKQAAAAAASARLGIVDYLDKVEAASYQCIGNPHLNDSLADYAAAKERYEVSEWNYAFSGFIDAAGGALTLFDDALFLPLEGNERKPLQVGELFSRLDVQNLKAGPVAAALAADGDLVYGSFSPSWGGHGRVAARLVKRSGAGTPLGVLVLLLNANRLSSVLASSVEELAGGAAWLLAEGGLVLASTERLPPASSFEASVEGGGRLLTQLALGLASGEGELGSTAEPRRAAFAAVPGLPWTVVAAVPVPAAASLAVAWSWLALAAFCLLAGAFARRIVASPWHSLAAAAVVESARSRPGSLTPPEPPAEEPAAGPPWLADLSERERAIVGLLAQGLSNKEIAAELGIKEQTVKNYLGAVYARMGVKDRVSAALLASSVQSKLLR